ncbi:MAG: spore germination protein [Bacillota bacterium]
MSIWQAMKRWLDPSATLVDDTFTLGDRGEKPASEEQGAAMLADARMHTESMLARIDRLLEAAPRGKESLEKVGDLSYSLDENLRRIKKLFRLPDNKDLVVRELIIATEPPTKAAVLFMEGLTNTQVINTNILQPLMLMAAKTGHNQQGQTEPPTPFPVELVKLRLLPGNQTSEKYDLASIAEALLAGDTVVLMDGARVALGVETKSPPARSVSEPKNEQVIWGPHDAFNEALRVNIALVRRRVKDPRLVTEILTVGEVSKTFVALMYIDTIVPPKLVAEAKRRVESIKVDILNGAGVLEQYIEDNPSFLLPSLMVTERPDRVAAYLSEGHVALFVDTTPYAVIAPTTFWSLIQTAEDYYLRWPFGTMLRYIRLAAVALALLLPALYISIVNYHQEMLPTDLLLFIAGSREQVPMPAVAELVVMDIVFELIREAGTRIPNVIGPTIGLVASLILGQAAVEAKIVSPIMILVVAVTGLASFAIPNYLVSWGVRLLRFTLLALATVLGFYGVAAGLFIIITLLSAKRSFGVPYLSPAAPHRGKARDITLRPPLFRMEERPRHLRPLNKKRQKEVVRPWDPMAPKQSTEEKGG